MKNIKDYLINNDVPKFCEDMEEKKIKNNHFLDQMLKEAKIKKEISLSSTKRAQSFRKRMRDKGNEWVCLWVPKEFKEKVKDFAKKLKGKN